MSQPKRSSSEKSPRKAPAVVDVEAPADKALPVKAPPPVAAEPEPQDEDEDEDEVLSETEPATDAELDLIEAEIGVRPAEPQAQAAPVTALVRRDPMGQYMAEVRRHPLLTREEEHALAVRWVEGNDAEAAKQLVTSNLRLVVKIAHEYKRAYQNLLDLVQEGNVGLIQAVKKFDPYRGVKLSTYSGWWIRAYILKFILNNWRLVKIGTTQNQRKLFFNLRKQVDRLKQAGVDPTPERIAAALDVSEAEVIEMDRRLSAPDMSLDAPLTGGGDEDDGRTRMDIIEDSSDDPEVEVESTEFKDILHAKLRRFGATLSGRELEIFRDRIVADEPITLQELGDRWGVSRERARQLEKRMVLRLREFLQAELGDAVQIALGHE
ncbi:RNA polymerase factor sigma-32 [Nannocystis sp. ILAH1]|uniref:RNA polymerase factor sigma-32 n=1 Tax=unclassified Nannocystis TaxID=2627009 RepID=UPI00226FF210|nr:MULTISPECIES: RNA polymerase factor sigma-32 [unclassified Nannocystis]MCY0989990.1 RNA polymerase factor sigma-32 [Nannocystis sp. ILAH1]MCY1066772.1 RNA polymerase factor sigma-32 [Nannocystis sp. RBIL2]